LKGIDLNGKTVLITGANNGIGLETARALAYHNAHVVMACRNLTSAEEAKNDIVKGYPNSKIDIIYMDSSKLTTVESCAMEYISKGWPLHVLILNAGVFQPPEKFTEDGFETTFQVNHLAHCYLVKLLADVLFKSAPARVVHVSSEAHRIGKLTPDKVTWEVLSPTDPSKVPMHMTTYARSKFCNVVFSNELNKRWKRKGVTSNSLHPGVVKTKISRNSGLLRFFLKLPFVGNERVITMDKGAATTVYAATAPEHEQTGGEYFNVCKLSSADTRVRDEEIGKNLWELSEHMITKWKTNKTNLPVTTV
jgi:WW domain-containing oxidoreductase